MNGTQEVAMVLRQVVSKAGLVEALRHLTPIPVTAFSGAEDDDGADDSGQTSSSNKSATPKTFSEEYVKELREENKTTREKAKAELEATNAQLAELQSSLEKYTEGEKTEIEKAQKAAAEATELLTSKDAKLRAANLDIAVLVAGTTLKFHDPRDAKAHLDLTEITFDDDGKPDQSQVTAQLKKVAEDKTYLVMAVGSGDGDGAARGTPPPAEDSEARITKHKETMKAQGRVMLPT